MIWKNQTPSKKKKTILNYGFYFYRYSEKVLERREINDNKREMTTEQIRQELAAREVLIESKLNENGEKNDVTSSMVLNDAKLNNGDFKELAEAGSLKHTSKKTKCDDNSKIGNKNNKTNKNNYNINNNNNVESVSNNKPNTKEVVITNNVKNQIEEEMGSTKEPETKSKKKRRKKSLMKKKATLSVASAAAVIAASTPNRKNSMSSSGGSGSGSAGPSDVNDIDTDPNHQSSNATSASIDDLAKSELALSTNNSLNEQRDSHEVPGTPHIYDLHFFSDTEAANSPYASRPSTPIQSDSEFEISQRDNLVKNEKNSDKMSASTASWKWGELPTTPVKSDAEGSLNKDAKQAERNSTISTMLSFMKESIKLRKSTSEGIYLSDLMDTDSVDPEVMAKYFPTKNQSLQRMPDMDDRESGNGTSLPLSPSSIEGSVSKSLEFDFDPDGRLYDK